MELDVATSGFPMIFYLGMGLLSCLILSGCCMLSGFHISKTKQRSDSALLSQSVIAGGADDSSTYRLEDGLLENYGDKYGPHSGTEDTSLLERTRTSTTDTL